ncbi:MAG: tetraacyldisaccharide 4'-kinase [Myxococcota bacterium]
MAKRPVGSRPLGKAVSGAWYEPTPGLGSRLLLACMAPASWAYDAATALRGRAYDRGLLRVVKAPIPVVSVGNLVVGGAGKTPVVMELARRLGSMGHKVAVVSRGYGADTRAQRMVSDGERILLPSSEAGDEPHLVARRCPGVAVFAGPNRADLVFRAAGELGCSVAILDDGMQHRSLHRHLEVVVVDASSPVGNGRLLPRGPMRERSACLARAHLVWLTRVDETTERPFEVSTYLDGMLARAGCPVVRSRYEIERITELSGREVGGPSHLSGRKVLALSGIARPRSFHELLAKAGARIVAVRALPDHHPFTAEEIAEAKEEAASQDAMVVTTEKDAGRIDPGQTEILVLRLRCTVIEGAEEIDKLLGGLPREPASGVSSDSSTRSA